MTLIPRDLEQLSLRPGVYLGTTAAGGIRLFRRVLWREAQEFAAGPARLPALRLLAAKPHSVTDLGNRLALDDHDRADVLALLDELRGGGWLEIAVHHDGRHRYTVQPTAPAAAEPTADESGVLSRFAVIHREAGRFVVESPLANARIQVHDAAVLAVIGALGDPGVTADDALTRRVRSDLARAGLLARGGAEDDDPTLAQWRPHELWFHRRLRTGNGGYAGAGFGRTNWAKATFGAEPAARRPFPAPPLELPRPDLARLRERDQPFTAVLEDRRSVRVHDDEHPMTLDQLAELLYRSARVRGAYELNGTECLSRPYPSGGSVYELELYPVVRNVDGLEPGMYHYDSHEHRLRLVRPHGPEVTRMLRAAAAAAVVTERPQVLIVISARFGRLMRSYEEMPYSIITRHVGVLYQTMYLVATSMGLAPCGLGAGDAAAFTEATGLDYLSESSVGEFMLGTRPA